MFEAITPVCRARQATENRFARFVWPAGEALAAWVWEAGPAVIAGHTVVELGAGLALPSFAACACEAAAVLATDAAYAADTDLGSRLDAMVAHNEVLHQMRTQALSWEDMAAVEALQKVESAAASPDLILAADVLYNQQGTRRPPSPDAFAPRTHAAVRATAAQRTTSSPPPPDSSTGTTAPAGSSSPTTSARACRSVVPVPARRGAIALGWVLSLPHSRAQGDAVPRALAAQVAPPRPQAGAAGPREAPQARSTLPVRRAAGTDC